MLTPRSGVRSSAPPDSTTVGVAVAPLAGTGLAPSFLATACLTIASMRDRSIIDSPKYRSVSGARREPAVLHEAHLLEPGLELGGGSQAQELAQRRIVVERRRLVVEHDVVAHGQGHEEVAARRREEHLEVLEIVLVGVGVVGVAGVAAHRDAV